MRQFEIDIHDDLYFCIWTWYSSFILLCNMDSFS